MEKEDFNKFLLYDKETGNLLWRKRNPTNAHVKSWNKRWSGEVAGTVGKNGYRYISLSKSYYLAHRIVWLLEYGSLPPKGCEIDHINRNRLDNRLENLRSVSRYENNRNKDMNKNNTSGVTGVVWHKASGKWLSRIYNNYQCINLGLFESFKDAVDARVDAEVQFGYKQLLIDEGVIKHEYY